MEYSGKIKYKVAATFSAVLWFVLSLVITGSRLVKSPERYELKYPANFGGNFAIPENNPLTVPGVRLGRHLFYETRLSANNLVACSSCHEQRYAFTDGKPQSIGIDGEKTLRNSMSLANLLWVRNFFWDGRVAGLEAQALIPMNDPHEMGQSPDESAKKLQSSAMYRSMFLAAFGTEDISGDLITKALSQFERTLISANSKYDQYLAGTYTPTQGELNGMALFMNNPDPEKGIRGANCVHCHGTPKVFKELFHNNGISISKDLGRERATGEVQDSGRFRVATLRNIALTSPYMHDGRFSTLEQVVDHYNSDMGGNDMVSPFIKGVSNDINGKTLGLTITEKRDIISFLHMLTDSTFIHNPNFSNPHGSNE